ncbi:MAG TPA: hypothetical protein VKU85_03525 [bacterium]|nr:hypothetical protein [bacterium]
MSAKGAQIVARRLDGGLEKGHAVAFEPGAEVVVETPPDGRQAVIPAADLKAVFFVKDLKGDSRYEDSHSYRDSQLMGRRVWVCFRDGEEMAGWSLSYRRGCEGFYVFPSDPQSNIEMAWVYAHAVRSVLTEGAAETASRDWAERARGKQFGRIAPEDWDQFLNDSR